MNYVLDTNAVIGVLKGDTALIARLKAHVPGDFGISSIVLHELFYGAFKSVRIEDNLGRIDALRFAVVDFDTDDARASGQIRAQLAAAGSSIGPYDVLIAGQALSRGLILMTRNLREFSRVEGLSAQDW